MPIWRYAGVATCGISHVRENAEWSHRGLFGAVGTQENRHLDETRRRIEAGTFRRGRQKTMALTYVRAYEMGRQGSLPVDGIVDKMARLNAAATRAPSRFKRTRSGHTVERLGTRVMRERGRKVVESRIRIGD